MSRERSDRWYPHLLRLAMKQGIRQMDGTKHQPTLEDIANWTGYGLRTVKSWLHPPTYRTFRAMPRQAIREVLHEFALRDHCAHGHSRYRPPHYDCEMCRVAYDWAQLLRQCQ